MIYLDKESKDPIYRQIYQQIKDDITKGIMVKDAPLKSLRSVEDELGISRNTVDRAYQQLSAEGYIRSVKGMGYFVEDIAGFVGSEVKKPPVRRMESSYRARPKVKYDFDFESVEADLFPWVKWKKCVKIALSQESSRSVVSYEDGKGSLALRKSLAEFLHRHRGVRCDPDQIVICPGTQYAMEIICSLFSPTTHRFAFEEPGYKAMRYLIEKRGYSVTSIPVLENGLYYELLTRSNCNLLYATPSHQFPTGYVTSIGTRNQLLRWAREREGAYIIENDYDSEFRHGNLPIPSLQSLDEFQKVIYMSTFSKMLSPAIRCAYMVLPWPLVDRFEENYRYFNAMIPAYHEGAIAEMIDSGSLEKHLRNLGIVDEGKYEAMSKYLKAYLPEYVEILGEPAGVHTMVRIHGCSDQKGLLAFLEKRSIRIYGIKEHCHDQINAYEDTFLLGYNAMTQDELEEGCRALAVALDEYFGNLGDTRSSTSRSRGK